MPVTFRYIWQLFVISLLFCLLIKSAPAQDVRTEYLQPRLDFGKLILEIHLNSLITPDLRETLSSGMRIVLRFEMQIESTAEKTSYWQREILWLRYDIWEKIFEVQFAKQIGQFTDFSSFNSFVLDSLCVTMAKNFHLEKTIPLKATLLIYAQNISDIQREKIDSWLTAGGENRESQPGSESESGFSVNISHLISMFLSKKEAGYVKRLQSKKFTLQELVDDGLAPQ